MVYHVTARGDGGKQVFEEDKERYGWIGLMEGACGSFGWRVHGWVLPGNHFHLLIETPEPNLVAGMKWMPGVSSRGWNRRRQRKGHVFQGRYKAVVVNGEERDGNYFKIVADCIHLNPVRCKTLEEQSRFRHCATTAARAFPISRWTSPASARGICRTDNSSSSAFRN